MLSRSCFISLGMLGNVFADCTGTTGCLGKELKAGNKMEQGRLRRNKHGRMSGWSVCLFGHALYLICPVLLSNFISEHTPEWGTPFCVHLCAWSSKCQQLEITGQKDRVPVVPATGVTRVSEIKSWQLNRWPGAYHKPIAKSLFPIQNIHKAIKHRSIEMRNRQGSYRQHWRPTNSFCFHFHSVLSLCP